MEMEWAFINDLQAEKDTLTLAHGGSGAFTLTLPGAQHVRISLT